MLQRLYIHNYKTFLNFELKLGEAHSSLLIGKNGAGKSSVAHVLRMLQSIGRGTNRLRDLIVPGNFFRQQTDMPMRFELAVVLNGHTYQYVLALELPEKFKELRVLEETLERDGKIVYAREQAQVSMHKSDAKPADAFFLVDWHLVALPLIQEKSTTDPVYVFKQWLARMVILAPIPSKMQAESEEESLWPEADASNTADWLSGLLGQFPAAYTSIAEYLTDVMPDLQDFRYESLGRDAKRLLVRFEQEGTSLPLDFAELSDGEKCFFLCAIIVAANKTYGPLFCFWDEPDNYLSLSEVGHFIMHLRRSFSRSGQIVVTSHNEEAIRSFSDDNTWVLGRKSHLEPTRSGLLQDLRLSGAKPFDDLIQSLILGEVEP